MSWKKFTAYQSAPTVLTYPTLPDDITYLRLFLGLAYGISLGMRESNNDGSLKGAMGILFGLNVITFLPIMYMSFFLNAVTDSYKYLNFAGVQNGLAFMMIVWTFFFTMLNEDVESELNSVVIKTIVNAAVGGDDNMSTEGGEDFVPVEESEF